MHMLKRILQSRLLRRAATGLALSFAFACTGLIALHFAFPFPKEKLTEAREERESVRVLDRNGRLLRTYNGTDDSRMFWVDMEDLSPHLMAATVAVEDERFYWHPGVDPVAVARAVGSNLRRGRVVSGASTITMQLMRILWQRPRTFRSKAIESFRALQIERATSKDEVMEWYLNLAPYGGNLVGVGAASLAYFRKPAKELTLGEAALLAGLPKSPSRLRPDRSPGRARRRRDHVLNRMHECGCISEEQLFRALCEPVPNRRFSPPFERPHWARLVRQRFPHRAVLRTTLDPDTQETARVAVREQVDALRPEGVTNGAVVVIENEIAAVRALVGSCDFFSEEDRGQVNGATAARSPGSALKPFTYALAFERGVCTPSTILADVPTSYVGYEPRNFDLRFRGPVSAADALSASLNIPAIELLRRTGPHSIYHLLKACGISTLTQDATRYGLSLALGSAEVRLLELANAYATLARMGIYRPVRVLEAEPLPEGERVLTRGAAYLTSQVLGETKRTEAQGLWKCTRNQIRMAWKTGTSYGCRDAWCLAYTPEFTVGVWLGNFSGRPSKALVGLRAAAPVAARIIDQIHSDRPSKWFERPDRVGTREICASSGRPSGPHCRAPEEGLFIRGHSPEEACSVHTLVRIDQQTGTRLCRHCSPGRESHEMTMEVWPVELADWFRTNQRGRTIAPPHFAGCPRLIASGQSPKILSPPPGQTYLFRPREGDRTQRVLLQAASSGGRLFWFVDGGLHAACASSEPTFWPLAKGRHTIICADHAGRSASVDIEVR